MRRLLAIACFAALLPIATGFGAGPFDGDWHGTMLYTNRSCGSMDKVSVHVSGNSMSGTAQGGGARKYEISGSISDNGNFQGKFSSTPIKGTASGNSLKAEPWSTANCGSASFALERDR